MIMNRFAFGLGSNSTDREQRMNECIAWLRDNMQSFQVSSIYETAALNGLSDPYFNAVAYGESDYSHEDMNVVLKEYEILAGRRQNDVNIIIDIDIVIYNNEIVRGVDFRQSYFQIGWNQLIK